MTDPETYQALQRLQKRQELHSKMLLTLVSALKAMAKNSLSRSDRKRWDAAMAKIEKNLKDD